MLFATLFVKGVTKEEIEAQFQPPHWNLPYWVVEEHPTGVVVQLYAESEEDIREYWLSLDAQHTKFTYAMDHIEHLVEHPLPAWFSQDGYRMEYYEEQGHQLWRLVKLETAPA